MPCSTPNAVTLRPLIERVIAPLSIVPYPRSLQLGEGFCPLGNVWIDCSDPELLPTAKMLAGALPIRPGAAAMPLRLYRDTTLNSAEAYSLLITPTGITLAAADPAGAFYALQTLMQLAFPGDGRTAAARLPCLQLDDAPTYGWRGMHLDCSRHFFDLDFIKRYIDLLALHKMNRFHWHLCDDQGWRLQSRAFPGLTETGAWRERSVIGHTANRERRYEERRYGGFYTREEVCEVVAYAAARHIAVLPEIDIPGHAAALLAAHPELSCDQGQYRVEEHYGIFPDVLCPTEACFSFLETLFTEITDLFPFEYLHIGGDEVVKDRWRDCNHCQQLMRERGMDSVDQLHGYFVARVEGILTRLGRRAIGWNEVMDGDISTDTTIMCWTGFDACGTALRAGHRAIMTPVERTYFDFYQSTSVDEPQAIHGLTTLRQVFDFDPMPPDLPMHLRERILGAQANVWTEYLRDAAAVEYACLPRMSALAEVVWTGPKRTWKHFVERLPAWSARLREDGFRVADSVAKPRITIVPGAEHTLTATLDCELPDVAIHYTLDGSTPDATSPRYTAPLDIAKDCILRCVGVDTNGRVYGDERQHLWLHRALHAPVYHWRNEAMQPAPEYERLTNGCLGRERIFHAIEWTAFADRDTDLVVDLQEVQDVNGLRLNFEAGAHRQLFFPSGLHAWLSLDGHSWESWFAMDAEGLAGGSLALDSEPCQARFLRLQLQNHDLHYGPEQRAHITRPVHIDEIVVI